MTHAFDPLTNHETFRLGERVRLKKLPSWVAELSEETQQCFLLFVGRDSIVEEVDSHGLYVLVGDKEIDRNVGGYRNDIRVEAEWLERVVPG